MKIMTILGTRPEIIRLSRVIPLLDQHASHILVHTGQNYDERLDSIFFEELQVRPPDHRLDIRGASFGEQVGLLLAQIDLLFTRHRPERVLILGDTNSGLVALNARRMGIPVYHMEAGNRCFDDRVPEEVNRRVIDHCSSVLLPYTERSRQNLLREGIAGDRIFVTGNPIKEVIDQHAERIAESRILEELGVGERQYFLVTVHRAENVDHPQRLQNLLRAFEQIRERHGRPIICSTHPRTRARLTELGIRGSAGIRFLEPLGLFDFVRLEQRAFCVLSDSGTVQEEACIFGVPNVTLREVTERPETVECGSNLIAGTRPEAILDAIDLVVKTHRTWNPPAEYLAAGVAETVVRIVLGHRSPDAAEVEWRAAEPRVVTVS